MIVDILRVTLPGFILGVLGMALANRRVDRATAQARWFKVLMFFLIVHLVLAVAVAGRQWVLVLLLAVLIAGGIELSAAWEKMLAPRPALLWPVYLVVSALVIVNAWRLPPSAFAFVFLVTATSDGFSQVIGQWLGRRPLVPRLSPKKTVGGLLGGLVAATLVAMLLRDLLQVQPALAAGLGLLAGITGLVGDLVASWVKRRAGIKDYSATLPGQGGFLDRFDSLLGAMALTGVVLLVIV